MYNHLLAFATFGRFDTTTYTMRVSHLVLVLLGSTVAAVLVPDASTGNQGGSRVMRFPTKARLNATVTQTPPNDCLDPVIDMASKAKAPAKPKVPSKPPAAPSKPKASPVQSTPAKPTKPAAGPQLGQSTLKTSTTSTPAAKSASSALPSSSPAPACPLRPRKRSMEDYIELDSWMGFDAGKGKRYTVVVLE
jgi:hypothetical protein